MSECPWAVRMRLANSLHELLRNDVRILLKREVHAIVAAACCNFQRTLSQSEEEPRTAGSNPKAARRCALMSRTTIMKDGEEL